MFLTLTSREADTNPHNSRDKARGLFDLIIEESSTLQTPTSCHSSILQWRVFFVAR